MSSFFLGDPLPPTPQELERREKAQLRVKKLADPLLLQRLERWTYHRMLPETPSLPMALRPQPTHFDRLADWYAGYLGVRGEYEAPMEMKQDLKTRVPQALLRDIFRPVRGEVLIDPVIYQFNLDGGRAALAEARQAQRREPLPTIEPALVAVVAEQLRRRRFLTQPWQPYRQDSAPRKSKKRPGVDDAADYNGDEDAE